MTTDKPHITRSFELNRAIYSAHAVVGTRTIIHKLGEADTRVDEEIPAIRLTVNRKETFALEIEDAWKLGTFLLKYSWRESPPARWGKRQLRRLHLDR